MNLKIGKALFVVLFLVIGLVSGCETTAGAAKGVACTVEGAGKDTVGLWGAIMQADSWIRENLW